MNEEVRRGQRAQDILNDEIVQTAIRSLRNQALDAFRQAGPKDHDALQNARLLYQVTESFVVALTDIVRDGEAKVLLKRPPLKPEDKFRPRHVLS